MQAYEFLTDNEILTFYAENYISAIKLFEQYLINIKTYF